MQRRAFSRAVLLVCTAALAAATSAAAIEGGWADSRDRAVGLIFYNPPRAAVCTGTLIRADVVLTAAHCLCGVTGPAGVVFITGQGVEHRSGLVRHEVAALQRGAGFSSASACDGGRRVLHDVALLRLATPIRDVPPWQFASALPARGQVCDAVGYGSHGGVTASAEKRRGHVRVVTSDRAGFIEVRWDGAVPGVGDSGGPLLCNGRIAGTLATARTMENGTLPPLAERFAHYEAHAHESGFIQRTLRGWPSTRTTQSSTKKSPAKKSPAKKSPAKKSPAKKSPAKKSPAKKSPAKKAPAKKAPARTAPTTTEAPSAD